jgi:hypothetical protein
LDCPGEAAEHSPIGAGAGKDDLINFRLMKNYFESANTNFNAIMVKISFRSVLRPDFGSPLHLPELSSDAVAVRIY